MWPFSGCDDDGCSAVDMTAITPASVIAASPFTLIFLASTLVAVRIVYPRLSSAAQDDERDGENHVLPAHAPAELRQAHAAHGAKSIGRRSVAWAFGSTLGLAVTMGVLILSEVMGIMDGVGKVVALRMTVPGLLFMLVFVLPWLECQNLVRGAGWSLQRTSKGTLPRFAWGLHLALFAGWLFAFWKIGGAVPTGAMKSVGHKGDDGWIDEITRECLERIGVVGIALMALLAGFASVSSPWHTFGESSRNQKPVSEGDVNRKQSGLDATREMLSSKKHRLAALERKVSDPDYLAARASGGFVGKMVGSFRGASKEETEIKNLRVEVSGLETMEANLASTLVLMKSRRKQTERASSSFGRFLLLPSYAFSTYCLYRILATALTTLRRMSAPSASFSGSDPINRFLGLLARHWDPKLDQLAWARIISFALCGLILVASANSAIQTFHLFAKWTPGLLRHAQANLALIVGQIAATYVISSSLVLRGQLPGEASSAVGTVLGGALSPSFVDGWFEGWFLAASFLTWFGLWFGRKVGAGGGLDDDWDDYSAEEMGTKRH